MGHGFEDLAKERYTLPEGYTFVCITQCGNLSYMDTAVKFMNLFSDASNEALLADPVGGKSAIESAIGVPIKVYTAGKSIPALSFLPLVDWLTFDVAKISRSGVQRFPLNPPAPQPDSIPRSTELTDPTSLIYKQLQHDKSAFGNQVIFTSARKISTDKAVKEAVWKYILGESVYPTLDEVLTTFKGTYPPTFQLFRSKFNLSVKSALERHGPGVYYFMVCREVKGVTNKVEIANRTLESLLQEFQREGKAFPDYSRSNARNTLVKLDHQKRYLESLTNEQRELIKESINLNYLEKAPTLQERRRFSLSQEGKGRRKQTRRKRKQTRRKRTLKKN